MSILSAGCAGADEQHIEKTDRVEVTYKNPYQFGAVGDGTHDDTPALRAAYEAAVAEGGGTVLLTAGRFFIPGHLDIPRPGVSLVSLGGAVVGGGEVRIGPPRYEDSANGVRFSGDRVSGIVFDNADDFGSARCLVLRNVRGLDVTQNYFRSGGKGIAVEEIDGNDKLHTTAMVRIFGNQFSRLTFGVYADTREWDRLSDWQISDNYFNYCSDTSVWIASTESGHSGGVDGLNFTGNTIFSRNHNASDDDPLFAMKRYNLRLGQTNWLRVVNNSFFEAGLSAVFLDQPKNFTFVGNHIAWPGQRELGDALEIRGGTPSGVVEGNTFAHWTRAAIGLYAVSDLAELEVGHNAWKWTETPNSWKGKGPLPGYRVYASAGGEGYPVIRDFHTSGAHDDVKGRVGQQSRDIKTPKGGVAGVFREGLQISEPVTVFELSDIGNAGSYGGMICMSVTNSSNESLIATYLLFVSSQGAVCKVMESVGYTDGADADHPSFTWELSGADLRAAPFGLTNGTFNFDGVSLGAVSLR
jgi:hypothetical protein